MSDVEYLLIGVAIGLGIRVLVAFLDGLVAMFEKDKDNKNVPRS